MGHWDPRRDRARVGIPGRWAARAAYRARDSVLRRAAGQGAGKVRRDWDCADSSRSPPLPAATSAASATCASGRLPHVKKVSQVKKCGYGFARAQRRAALSLPHTHLIRLSIRLLRCADSRALLPSAASCRIPDPAPQRALLAPAAGFRHQICPFRRAIPRPVAAAAKTGKAATILAGTPHRPGAP